MDFALLPPEINSERMYVGVGPMVAAAPAWDGLSAELNFATSSYRGAVSELTGGPWVGPSSTMTVAAVVPYVSWMSATAAQAEQTATQLKSAVAAFVATVPPPEIEVNRALLASLVATNFSGQNTPAIAATEAQYAQMWAQDAAAMYGYAGASAVATKLTAFTSAPQTTNSSGKVLQAASVNQAGASSTGSTTRSALSNVPNLLQNAASGLSSRSSAAPAGSGSLLDLFNNFSENTVGYQILSVGLNFGASGALLTITQPVAAAWNPLINSLSAPATAASQVSGIGKSGSALLNSPGPGIGLGAAGASAQVGQAASLGKLSVPQSLGTSPAIRLAATALPSTGLDGLPRTGAAAPGFLGGIPPMGPVASVVNAPRNEQGRLRAGAHHKVIRAAAAESGMHPEPATRWVKLTSDAAVSERDELNQLREAIADVTRQRDVLKRTATNLIQEATNR